MRPPAQSPTAVGSTVRTGTQVSPSLKSGLLLFLGSVLLRSLLTPPERGENTTLHTGDVMINFKNPRLLALSAN